MEQEIAKLSTSLIADVIRMILSWLGQLSPIEVGMIICGVAVLWFVKMLVQK